MGKTGGRKAEDDTRIVGGETRMMTTAEFLKIDVDLLVLGRELNDLVAVKVMGWKYIDDLHWKYNGEFVKDGRPFNPSTNIADAWLVAERMIDRGFEYIVTNELFIGRHCCEFVLKVNREFRISACGDTAPLAICKAALKARQAELRAAA